MENDDFLDILDASDEEIEKELDKNKDSVKKEESRNYESKKESLYDKKIEAREPDREAFVTYGRNYCVSIYDNRENEVPEEVLIKMEKISKALFEKGFVFRNSGNTDKLTNSAISGGERRMETFLPWKKFNEDANNVKLKSPNEKAYEVAASYHKKFNDMPSAVRAIIARDIHCILGENVDAPANIIFIYSPDKAEKPEEVDFKKTRSAGFFINVGTNVNSVIINLAKDDSMEKVKQFILGLK